MDKAYSVNDLEESILKLEKDIEERFREYEIKKTENHALRAKIKEIEKEIYEEAKEKVKLATEELAEKYREQYSFVSEYEKNTSICRQLKSEQSDMRFRLGNTLKISQCTYSRCNCSNVHDMEIFLTDILYRECGHNINAELVGIIKKITNPSREFTLFNTVKIKPCIYISITIVSS